MNTELRGDELSACLHRITLSRVRPHLAESTASSTDLFRRDSARRLRHDVFEELAARHGPLSRARDLEQTKELMSAGTSLIIPTLGPEVSLRRFSHAHVLVRTGRTDENFTYSPLLIKNIAAQTHSSRKSLLVSTLEAPWPSQAIELPQAQLRRTATLSRTVLSLLHACKTLASLGHLDSRQRAGIVDRERRVTWINFDDSSQQKILTRYEQNVRERLELLQQLEQLPTKGTLPTSPWWHRECVQCVFAAHCHAELEAIDDVSLVRFTNLDEQRLLKQSGLEHRQSLAEHESNDPELERAIPLFSELVYRARVSVADQYLRKVESIEVPRADVEVDIDMESYDARTYLWGVLVSTPRPVEGVTEGYFPFVNWGELNDENEAHVFEQFWAFLSHVRSLAQLSKASCYAYCFWAQAEDGAMDRALQASSDVTIRNQVDSFRSAVPPVWIDLHALTRSQIQTEGPTGLKEVARYSGFEWRDEEPSGEASMRWYELTRSEVFEEVSAARQRLLDYNEDDCRATQALRRWLSVDAPSLPHRDRWRA